MRVFQASRNQNVSQVQRPALGQIDARFPVPGRQAIEIAANLRGRQGGAWPSVVAAYSLILGETKQHGAARSKSSDVALPVLHDFAQTEVIRPVDQIPRRLRRLKPCRPLGLV